MTVISITVYANDGNDAENRSDANNGQSSNRVSAFSHHLACIVFAFAIKRQKKKTKQKTHNTRCPKVLSLFIKISIVLIESKFDGVE